MALAALAPSVGQAPADTVRLGDVTVKSSRPLRDIGVTALRIDSMAIRDNISQTLADALSYGTSAFVKSSGRASMSTVSLRGTSPSHTVVTWNGMKISSPMLGMVDFSKIPTFFVDNARVYYGPSGVGMASGGLGGLVDLTSGSDLQPEGLRVSYTQGAGSFTTFDEYIRISYGSERWSLTTRVSLATSRNDFKYVNRDRNENIYDDNHQIIGQYHPVERNRSGTYRDFNVMQEALYDAGGGHRVGAHLWYSSDNRELPMLTVDYGDEREFENRQRDHTWRAMVWWRRSGRLSGGLRAGYTNTWNAYDYRRQVGPDVVAVMADARSRTSTIFARGDLSWMPASERWLLSGELSLHHNSVKSTDRARVGAGGVAAPVGYNRRRPEVSAAVTARWQPSVWFAASAVARLESYGSKMGQPVPTLLVDGVLWHGGGLRYKFSVMRNYRFPTLNDLYFIPGGNTGLRPESGTSYDAGLSLDKALGHRFGLRASAMWFDSYIDDWIIWLPSVRGYFSPVNLKNVHSYGIELTVSASVWLLRGVEAKVRGAYSWTPSVNRGPALSPADNSVGKQLPYVPVHSASVMGAVEWRRWSAGLKWLYYSRRYTMTSNDPGIGSSLPAFVMTDMSVSHRLPLRRLTFDFKIALNNIFNNRSLSVMSYPMPGFNTEFFVTVSF